MKRAQLVPQGSLNRILQAAEEAWNKRDFQQTIDQLERAVRLAPGNSQVLLQLGRIYGLRYDYAAAERCFEKAIKLGSSLNDPLAAAARHASEFTDKTLANVYLQRCLARDDAPPDIFVRMAELCERQHRAEQASELIDRALAIDSKNSAALLTRARLDRLNGNLVNAEKVLQLLEKAENRETRAKAHYEMGMLLDQQRSYDEAMNAFLQAKALLRSDAAPFLEYLELKRARLREMQTNISKEMFQRWRDANKVLEPQRRIALLCGHPRSGTTLLEQVLESHPEVISAEETDIFHDEAYVPLRHGFPEGTARMLPVLDSAQSGALQQSRERYFRFIDLCLGATVGNRMLIDKNPSLTVMIPAMLRVFPEAKFLVALRDPRDVCLSCFMQSFVPVGKITSAYISLEDTVKEYAVVMGMWTTLAPLVGGAGIEVRYEDMVEDLESVSRRVLDFIGLPWMPEVLKFHEHAQKKIVRSPTYADVAKPIFKRAVGRWRNYEKYLTPYLEKLEPFVKQFGYG